MTEGRTEYTLKIVKDDPFDAVGLQWISTMDLDTRMALVEQKYEQLDARLEKVEHKLDVIYDDMQKGQNSLVKVIIGAAGTIVTGLLSIVVVILMNA